MSGKLALERAQQGPWCKVLLPQLFGMTLSQRENVRVTIRKQPGMRQLPSLHVWARLGDNKERLHLCVFCYFYFYIYSLSKVKFTLKVQWAVPYLCRCARGDGTCALLSLRTLYPELHGSYFLSSLHQIRADLLLQVVWVAPKLDTNACHFSEIPVWSGARLRYDPLHFLGFTTSW